MTLPTLLLLQRCLRGQSLSVADEAFTETAPLVVTALAELDAEIAGLLVIPAP